MKPGPPGLFVYQLGVEVAPRTALQLLSGKHHLTQAELMRFWWSPGGREPGPCGASLFPAKPQDAQRVLSAPIQTEQESLACHSGSWEPTWEAQVPPFTPGAVVSPMPGSPAGASQRGELARR